MKNNKAAAAVFVGANKPFELREYPITELPEGYAGLSLLASGVCGTDLHIHSGHLGCGTPAIIGHEFIGRIEQIPDGAVGGDGNPLKEGDNALCYIACACGKCKLCAEDDDANCVNMNATNDGSPDDAPHFWGGFAEYNYQPIKNLAKVPDDIDPVAASLFACAGPTALHAFRLARRAGIDPASADCAVVQGAGPVGLFAVWYLASLGINRVICVTGSANPEKIAAAKAFGASDVPALAELGEDGVAKAIADMTGGLGADLCYEGSGSRSAFPFGMRILRNRGVYLVPGQYSDQGKVEISPELITFKALHIVGSSQYSMNDIADYLTFLKENKEMLPKMRSLLSAYPVADINKAFEDAYRGRNIKTVLI